MILETHDQLRKPEVRPATRLVVYDNFRNPIAVFVQVSPTEVFMRFKTQSGFEEALKNLGIRDTSVATVVSAKDLPELRVE